MLPGAAGLTCPYLNTPAAGISKTTACSLNTPPAPAGFCRLGLPDPSPDETESFQSNVKRYVSSHQGDHML